MSYHGGDTTELVPVFDPPPVLRVPLEQWRKMMGYVLACPVEINGFGYVDQVGPGTYRLAEVFILDQIATGVSVEVSARTLATHMSRMREENIPASRLRFQWHSHVEMAAYFSGVDVANIDDYLGEWAFSLVVNKSGRFDARLDVYRPFRVTSPLQVVVETTVGEELMTQCAADVNRFVRRNGFVRTRPIRGVSREDAASELPPTSLDLGRQ